MAEHILVVDDEPDMQQIIQLAFKRDIRADLYEFSFALNGAEALEILLANPDISVLLTDINMPEMDGLTLLQEIKRDKQLNERIRAVVISAYGDMTNIRTAMNHGAFDFLTKPIDLKDLKITVRKTIEETDLIKQILADRDHYTALKKELEIARGLQLSMMPHFPTRVGEFNVEGQMQPSSDVGGDFWDLIPLNESETLLVLGDCSGHGLSSALIMSAIRHSLLTLVTQIQDYRDFIPPLNHIVYREFKSKASYATMIFLHVQKGNPCVRMLRAGHELPVIRRNGSFEEPDWRGGLPIGIFPKRYKDPWIEIELQQDDELYLYTDGIVDGMPNRESLKLTSLLGDSGKISEMIANKGFFDHLARSQAWRNTDDATLIKITRNNSH